jgi:redox-sensitive bicupin YhaK (pirin superfamily)
MQNRDGFDQCRTGTGTSVFDSSLLCADRAMGLECQPRILEVTFMLHTAGPTRISRDNGGFVANLNFPGWLVPLPRDHGHGALAMIAESLLVPGRVIEMHEHQNDEIISWVPEGVMRHDDRARGPLVIDAGHLLVMNAGRSFWHSERTLDSDPPLRMLQILVRPGAVDLEPRLQFGPLPPPRANEWRHVFGPEGGDAPFSVRNRVDCYDIRLDAGATATLPRPDGCDAYFYVFSGRVEVGGRQLGRAAQGLMTRRGHRGELRAIEPATIVSFAIDPRAEVARRGTVGDHRAIPKPWLAPLLKLLLALRPRPKRRSRTSQRT